MVDVCVREDDGGDLARVERERLAIERFERPGSLEQAAIDQDRAAVMFKLHARACDCPRGAVEGDPGLVIRHCTCSKLAGRSEEHTSELQSLMRNSYAVFF